jgi:elongation factor P hydroxylase
MTQIDVLFWFTGIMIWVTISVVLATIVVVVSTYIVVTARQRVKNWCMIRYIMKYDISLDDMDDIRNACDYASYKHGKPFKDKKDCYDWILCVAENFKHRKSLDNNKETP